jgi:hypothetical protein
MRTEIWVLKVSDWSRAVEAGVQPLEIAGYPSDIETNPAYYRPSVFNFSRPPSRADFLKMCERLPWTSVWKDDVFPLIELNAWPMVESTCKAASSDLFKDGKDGAVVGRLDLSRDYVYDAESYPRTSVYLTGQEIIKRLRKGNREAANRLLREKKNELMELIVSWAEADGGGNIEDDMVWRAIHRILYEGGLRSKP